MSDENKYNGWSNYETWAVKLWIDSEQSSHLYWQSLPAEIYQEAEATEYSTRSQVAIRTLADRLKEEHEEALPEVQGFVADLLNAAMSEVNWREIAESLFSDNQDEIEEIDKQEHDEEEDDDDDDDEDESEDVAA